jgi:DNA-binding transcriptional LysR family regulator
LRAAAHGPGVALVFDPLIDSEIMSGALVRVGPRLPARSGLARLPAARTRPAGGALRRWLLAQLGGAT